MSGIRHAVFHETGRPEDIVRVEEATPQTLEPQQVRVGMQFAPINPADINYLQGTYGKKPTLPAIPGMEGVGTILETGKQVLGLAEGDQVILNHHIGTWAEEVCVAQDQVIPIRPSIPPQQAAMLRVNPPTAWRLLTGYRTLHSGDWIVQNAANSGVGLAVIQLAKLLNIRTLNVVRRDSAREACQAAGAEHVMLDGRDLKAAAAQRLAGQAPQLAFNAVGGDSALRLMDLLASEGIHVTYGAMARQALKVPNQFLIFKQIQLRGLWVTAWMNAMPPVERQQLFDQLAGYVRQHQLSLPIESVYPLGDINRALIHAQADKRSGKVMIDLRRSP